MRIPAIGQKPIPRIEPKRPTGTHAVWYQWDGQPMRAPKEGEHFLSGAIPGVYLATSDLSQEYFIMVRCSEQDRCPTCQRPNGG